MSAVVGAPARASSLARGTTVVALGLWGVVHVVGGVALVVAGAGDAALATVATAREPAALTGDTGVAVARLVQFHGLNIALAGLAVIVLARLTAREWGRGLGAALAVVAAADLGLVLFLLVPGVMAATDGLPGPLLLLVALAAAWRGGWPTRGAGRVGPGG